MRSDSLRAEGWSLVIGNGWSHVRGKRQIWRAGRPDVDLIVQVEPGRSILAVGGLLDEMSELLGKPVHVVTARSLSKAASQRALREAVPL